MPTKKSRHTCRICKRKRVHSKVYYIGIAHNNMHVYVCTTHTLEEVSNLKNVHYEADRSYLKLLFQD